MHLFTLYSEGIFDIYSSVRMVVNASATLWCHSHLVDSFLISSIVT